MMTPRHALYVGWIAGLAARYRLPLQPCWDDSGDYAPELELAVSDTVRVRLVVPEPPAEWWPGGDAE